MTTPLPRDVNSWDDGDRREFFRLLGLKLEEFGVNGRALELPEATHVVAVDLVEDEGAATNLGDDILNDEVVQDTIYEHQVGSLIWLRWTESMNSTSDGVKTLDFGTDVRFAAYAPNEDFGRSDWKIIAVIDPADENVIQSIVVEYLSEGPIADEVSVTDVVGRQVIHDAYTAALDGGLMNTWGVLADWLERHSGSKVQIDTPEQRSACLSAYLDEVLEVTTPLPLRIEMWHYFQRREFFRRLGRKLEEFDATGQLLDFHRATYAIAADLVDDAEEASMLGDDIVDDDLIRDDFHRYDNGWLVFMSWTESRTGMADGFKLMDFGTRKVFVVLPPNEDEGRSWEVVSALDRDDEDALRGIVLSDLASGAVPDKLMVSRVSREEVHDAYTAALDRGLTNDWPVLADWVSRRLGATLSIDTPEQRAKCLDAYLDEALEE